MPRFFVEEIPEGEVYLGGEDGRHVAKSLRMRPGETLTLCDGQGWDYPCTLVSTDGEGALVRVEDRQPSRGEPRTKVTVCQCLAKGDKLDTVTQKSVELGAWEIWPVESSRCVVRLDGKSAGKKTARLQKIAREAAMQSGRGAIPRVLEPAPLKQALETAAKEGEILFFYERGEESLMGPEGGFSPEEAELARSLGGKLLTLGPRILRTETAPLAALSCIFYQTGDMELEGRNLP